MLGGKKEKMMKERKKERGVSEAEAGSAAQGAGGHFRGQNHARGRELRA